MRRTGTSMSAVMALMLSFGAASHVRAATLTTLAADPTGTWILGGGRARVRIEKCGPQLTSACGYVVWLREPLDDRGAPRKDVLNPDPARKDRPLLGLQVMAGLKQDGKGHYAGQTYDADVGRIVDVAISADRPQVLLVHGCVMKVMCGSEAWARALDFAPGQLRGATNALDGPRTEAASIPDGSRQVHR